MDCEEFGNGNFICGNFAERQESKPENFDFMTTGKWYEDYPFGWRETLGGVICNCKRIKVNYAPYYGFDHFHLDTCNLMRKLAAEPGLANLMEIYLPSITRYTDSVPNSDHIPLYIKGLSSSRARKIKVKTYPPQLSLV
jgi:hypothetical protein